MLDLDTIRRLTNEAIAERGADFVYSPRGLGYCTYVPLSDPRYPTDELDLNNAPAAGAGVTGCLVGDIARRAGLLTDEIASSIDTAHTLIERDLLPVSGPGAKLYLTTLQSTQDTGGSWGAARDDAEAAVRQWQGRLDRHLAVG